MLTKLGKCGKSVSKNIFLFGFGLVFFLFILIFSLISLPIYLYRLIVINAIAPFCRKGGSSAVTLSGAVFASEFAHNFHNPAENFQPASSKSVIVACIGFEGQLSLPQLKYLFKRKWIRAKNPGTGGPLYPELGQHLEKWLGYLFWTPDSDDSSKLKLHLKEHSCQDCWTERECERFACALMEELLNRPFPKARSPWEVHLVHKYKNSELLPDGREVSLVILRFHRALLADGNSLSMAICEGLFDISFPEAETRRRRKKSWTWEENEEERNCPGFNFCRDFSQVLSWPLRALRDLGYLSFITCFPTRTPWEFKENDRNGSGNKKYRRLNYSRSGMIPLKTVKFVKNAFKVSFNSVLVSCVAGAISKSFGGQCKRKRLPCVMALPFNNRILDPTKFIKNTTETIIDLPIHPELSPIERLRKSDKLYQESRRATYPFIAKLLLNVFASYPPCLLSWMTHICRFRSLGTALTSFPGSAVHLKWNGCEVLTKDFTGGLTFGDAGAAFTVLSYCDHLRIGMTAENGSMDRKELEGLVGAVCNELDVLYDLAMKNNDIIIYMDE